MNCNIPPLPSLVTDDQKGHAKVVGINFSKLSFN